MIPTSHTGEREGEMLKGYKIWESLPAYRKGREILKKAYKKVAIQDCAVPSQETNAKRERCLKATCKRELLARRVR